MSDAEQAYRSTKPCGCAGIVVMERDHEAPRMVAAAIKRGETVGRATIEDVRDTPLRCDEHRKPVAHEMSKAGALELPGMETVAVRPAEGRGYPN